ncbi:MAG: hypothetical protein AVDCRST_MAG19-1175, partial [uncultured Thermomicrobiales bacterium]
DHQRLASRVRERRCHGLDGGRRWRRVGRPWRPNLLGSV